LFSPLASCLDRARGRNIQPLPMSTAFAPLPELWKRHDARSPSQSLRCSEDLRFSTLLPSFELFSPPTLGGFPGALPPGADFSPSRSGATTSLHPAEGRPPSLCGPTGVFLPPSDLAPCLRPFLRIALSTRTPRPLPALTALVSPRGLQFRPITATLAAECRRTDPLRNFPAAARPTAARPDASFASPFGFTEGRPPGLTWTLDRHFALRNVEALSATHVSGLYEIPNSSPLLRPAVLLFSSSQGFVCVRPARSRISPVLPFDNPL